MSNSCPSSDQLAQMVAGALDEAQTESLIAHIDDCADCQTQVERLESKDPLDDVLASLNQFQPKENVDSYRLLQFDSGHATPSEPLELPATIGPYQLICVIAVGGMATVYRVRHHRLGKPFALKLLDSEGKVSRSKAQRIQREWRAHGSLNHPNIVTATDAGIIDRRPYLVTEFVEGSDLSKLVKERGPLKLEYANEVLRQAATGLAYAHETGLIHGDVKPSNLMLNVRGVVKVLDLGTAKWLDENTHVPSGTIAFMAPEQFDKHSTCDSRSDIYSLGCTYHYLLTGRTPFDHVIFNLPLRGHGPSRFQAPTCRKDHSLSPLS